MDKELRNKKTAIAKETKDLRKETKLAKKAIAKETRDFKIQMKNDTKTKKMEVKNDKIAGAKEFKTKNAKAKKTNNPKVVKKASSLSHKKKSNKNTKHRASDKYVVKVKNVKMQFGSFLALKGITFEVKKGERVGIIGGNGAGKTTITEIIAGINKPTSGTIRYGFSYKESPKEGIGMQFQQSEYPSGLTVKDIISFAINLRKVDISAEDLKDLLEKFQMTAFYTRKVRSLSGGQRQKLNILLSIIHNPSLVILDELSTGLDISAREEIISFTDNFLREKNMSSILISHHMAEIRALCDRVVILDNGAVADIRTIDDIEKNHGGLEKYVTKLIEVSNQRTINLASGKDINGNVIVSKAQKSKDKKRLDKQIAKEKKHDSKEKAKVKARRDKRNKKAIKKYGDVNLKDLEPKKIKKSKRTSSKKGGK